MTIPDEDGQRHIQKEMNSWAIRVLNEHFEEEELADKVVESDGDFSSVRDELLQKHVFMIRGDGEYHCYVVQVDTPMENTNPEKAMEIVTEHAENAVVQAGSLVEDDRVDVLGEFKMGVFKATDSGADQPTVKSSVSGKVSSDAREQEQV